MDGFFMLCGHLAGDYIFQNDWMASNKANPHPGPFPRPALALLDEPGRDVAFEVAAIYDAEVAAYPARYNAWLTGIAACITHCVLYTFAVWVFTFWWMPWWGLLACFAAHYPCDRFRLARRWMAVTGQEKFATGALSPWSIVVVDNTIHLLTLAAIAAVAIHA